MSISALRGHVAAVMVLFGLASSPVCAGEVRAAVASNFSAPMERIVALFQQESGHTVKVSPGSSGKFYSQIKGGAPFDVFLAADEALPKRLEQEGLAAGGSRFVYALGKLVPEELHKPVRQAAVLLSGAKDQAVSRAFLAFLRGEKAAAVMRSFGYELP